MDTSTLHTELLKKVQWAGNGLLTYHDPSFQDVDQGKPRVSSAREANFADEDKYSQEPYSSCQYQVEVSWFESGSESDGETPRPVRPRVSRQVAIENHMARQQAKPQQRVAEEERRRRHHSTPPPQERRRRLHRRAVQGQAPRWVEQGQYQQPQPPRPLPRDEQEEQGRRPQTRAGADVALEPLRQRFERASLQTELPSPELPRTPTPPPPYRPRSQRTTPEKSRPVTNYTNSSSPTSASASSSEPRPQSQESLAKGLSIIDAKYGIASKLKREDDVGSMIVEFHCDDPSRRRRHRHRSRRESQPAQTTQPAKSRSSGLGFLSRMVKNA
ncbi:hypothetical protein F4781DRAFT_433535 [Annulohypoxylon bovei var. microspora]|nr:hypothetical protein F4781DRAFT_433535 [Annulohypoxylon bovei var. microspora]